MVRQVPLCAALLGCLLSAACGDNKTIYIMGSSSSGGGSGSGSGGSSGTSTSSGSSGNGPSSGSSGSGSSSGGQSSSSSGGGPSSSSSGGQSSSSSGGQSSSSSGGMSSSSSSGSSSGGTSSGGVDACLPQHTDNFPASDLPPGGLMPSQVPQFVMFGSDDNPYAAGVDWLVDTAFGGKTNPDGTPAQITFFITAGYGTSQNGGVFIPGTSNQTEADVVNSWKHAYAQGHEIGNHTWDHLPNHGGLTDTTAQWTAEITPAQSFLTSQVGIPACELDNWRFPYLEFDDDGVTAFQQAGLVIDTSMEFGYNWWQPPDCNCNGYGPGAPQSGQWYWWPMTLDSGPPSVANSGFDPTETKGVGAHAGVWEFFEHVFNAPDPAGDQTNPTTIHTVTGLDYNLWLNANTQHYDFCNTLKYSFLQKYNGNRAPFNVGIHSMYYSGQDPTFDTDFGNTLATRQAGLQCFIDFLFSGSYPDVRVVGFHKVIEWMRNPAAIH